MPTLLFQTKNKVSGGAMYYAIFLTFILTLIVGLFVLSTSQTHYLISSISSQDQLRYDIQSANNIILNTPRKEQSDSIIFDLYGDSAHIAQVNVKSWGCYQLIFTQVDWVGKQRQSITMVGINSKQTDTLCLYLADNERYLSVGGTTLLKGQCFLPKQGIRSAVIEGQNYSNKELIEGKSFTSKSSLPELSKQIQEVFQSNQYELKNDSIVNIRSSTVSDDIANSFFNKTLRLKSKYWITIDGGSIVGNIKISSDLGIYVKSSATIQDALLIAPYIKVDDGFVGSGQLIARDTIVLGNSCQLTYPSAMVVISDSTINPFIKIGKNFHLKGDIILKNIDRAKWNDAKCKIDRDGQISGKIYCDGALELKSNIYGSVYCQGFQLTTSYAFYENNLLNITIDRSKLSPFYSSSILFDKIDLKKTIKTLE